MLRSNPGEARLASVKLGTMWHSQVVVLASTTVSLLTTLGAVLFVLGGSPGGGVGMLLLALAGLLCALVGSIMYLVGLYGMRPLDGDYGRAFSLSILHVVLGLIADFMEEGSALYQLLDLVTSALAVVVMWLAIQATDRLLVQAGREELRDRGRTAFWLTAAAMALPCGTELVTTLLADLDEALAGGLIALLIALALSIAGSVLYILYLRSASLAMGAYAWQEQRRLESELGRERGADGS